MFLCVGILQNYIKERNILQITGLIHISPYWAYIFGILCISNAGFPSTFSFIAEFFIISGIFEYYPVLALITYIPIALCAHRSFFLFTQVAFGSNFSYMNEFKLKTNLQENNTKEIFIVKNWDLVGSETIIMIQIFILTFYWGINPNFFFESLISEISSFNLLKEIITVFIPNKFF